MLRASREGKTQALCPSEANFPELYQVLGSPAAQDAIRQANPDGKHCELLRVNSTACAQCPVGQNPYLGDEGRDGDLYRAMEDHGDWLRDAEDLWDLQQLGLGVSPSQISPEQFEVLCVMRRNEVATLAQAYGFETARILSQLISAKKES